MKTNAVLFEDVNRVGVGKLEMPPPQAGQALVRTLLSTVSCGTEGWVLQDRFTWHPSQYPCVPGYQRVGVVEQIGPGVEGWSVGRKVVATVGHWPSGPVPRWGAHAALANTPVGELYAVPEGVNDLDASALVVAQVGYNAARARGMRVILVGHRAGRLRLAEAHSADAVVDSHAQEPAAAIKAITGSERLPAVIDTVQGTEVQAQYMTLIPCPPGDVPGDAGQIVYAGFSSGDTWADMAELQKREATTHFVSGWNRARLAREMWGLIANKEKELLGVTFQWEEAHR
jgi:NADPH:quinone reductase-like Zn-dependent oxidoreductase